MIKIFFTLANCLLLLFFLVLFSKALHAEQVAIVNVSLDFDRISIKRVLLAKTTTIRLCVLNDLSKENRFTRKYAGKSAATINRKWQRLVFSGRVKPPIIINTEEEMLEYIASNANAIGHVNSDTIITSPNIKVVQ